MANSFIGNPITVDTAAIIFTKYTNILAMQWVDNDGAAGGNIADTEGLVMLINGVAVQLYCADISAVSPLVWSISWPVAFGIEKLVVNSIDGGTLLIWKA